MLGCALVIEKLDKANPLMVTVATFTQPLPLVDVTVYVVLVVAVGVTDIVVVFAPVLQV